MGEKEFFDRIKKANRELSSRDRKLVWDIVEHMVEINNIRYTEDSVSFANNVKSTIDFQNEVISGMLNPDKEK